MERVVSRYNRYEGDPAPGVYNKVAGRSEFVRPLPETPFWETDIVKWQGKPYYVIRITDWTGENGPEYIISETLTGGAIYSNILEENLALVKRGNLWKKVHGQPLEFENIKEEAEFFYRIGEIEELKGSKGEPFRLSREDAIRIIRNGKADAFLDGGYLERVAGVILIRYENRELGERVRSYLLKNLDAEEKTNSQED